MLWLFFICGIDDVFIIVIEDLDLFESIKEVLDVDFCLIFVLDFDFDDFLLIIFIDIIGSFIIRVKVLFFVFCNVVL